MYAAWIRSYHTGTFTLQKLVELSATLDSNSVKKFEFVHVVPIDLEHVGYSIDQLAKVDKYCLPAHFTRSIDVTLPRKVAVKHTVGYRDDGTGIEIDG